MASPGCRGAVAGWRDDRRTDVLWAGANEKVVRTLAIIAVAKRTHSSVAGGGQVCAMALLSSPAYLALTKAVLLNAALLQMSLLAPRRVSIRRAAPPLAHQGWYGDHRGALARRRWPPPPHASCLRRIGTLPYGTRSALASRCRASSLKRTRASATAAIAQDSKQRGQ